MIEESRIADLEAKIVEASTAYYESEQFISEEEWSKLVTELRSLDPENHLLHRTGWGYVPAGKKEDRHQIPVGSLPKIHDLSHIDGHSVLSPKLDGMSLVAYYKKGILQSILTRGNGTIGIDVTNKIVMPQEINDPDILAVRGEGVLLLSDFEEKLSDEYANPRNAVGGIVNANNSHHLPLVKFVGYQIVTDAGRNFRLDSINAEILTTMLTENGFTPCPWIIRGAYGMEDLNRWRTKQLYWTDGIVSEGNVAIKFETDQKETSVLRVHWNQTKTSKFVPVLEIEPTELHGTVVKRVTAFNAKFVKEHALGAGARIILTKANEIIPHIVKVTSPGLLVIPEVCLNCKAPVEWHGVHIVCSAKCHEMDSRLKNFIWTFANIKNMGDSMLNKILYEIDVKNLTDWITFIEYPDETIQECNLTVREKEFLIKIVAIFRGPLDRRNLLNSLNFDGLGWANSCALEPHLEEIITHRSMHAGMVVQNAATVMAQVLNNLDLIEIVFKAFNWQSPKESETPDKDIKWVVLTGKMSMSRKKILEKITPYGYQEGSLKEGVTLVCADPNSNSSKMKKARKLGVEIISEDELWERISGD